jgi:2,4-dienoyl-CoA reductase-like NADH-dependent reductase (Old Yellow Enzyme family)
MSNSNNTIKKNPLIFEPIQVGPMTLPNRVLVSPMCQFSAEDGVMTDWHLVHLGGLATHGCANIIVEATSVTPEGRIAPSDVGLWNEKQELAHARVLQFIEKLGLGTRMGIQLAHAGRKASTREPWKRSSKLDGFAEIAEEKDGGWPGQVIGPDSSPYSSFAAVPKAMTIEQIKGIVKGFGNSAERAVRAGYHFIEIHAAHGYLLNQFLSPLSNSRNDDYGGSLGNRSRLIFEIAKEIRDRVGYDIPLGIRFSCYEYVDGGLTPEDCAEISVKLLEAPYKLDFFDCSSGGNDPRQKFPSPIPLGYQVEFAEKIKSAVGDRAKVFAVGLIVEPAQCEDILNNTNVDCILIARQFLREPSFMIRAAREFGVRYSLFPDQYVRSLISYPKYESLFKKPDEQEVNQKKDNSSSIGLLRITGLVSTIFALGIGVFIGKKFK